MIPAVSADAVAARLGVFRDERLEQCVGAAVAMLLPRVDPVRVAAQPALWDEACIQLAIKIWDTGTRGTSGLDAVGDFDIPQAATAGLWRTVLGLIAPLARAGGVTVA